MDRYIGRMLDDRYEILEVIGTGGMAVVYKALCHRLNRMVAIKILKDENMQDDTSPPTAREASTILSLPISAARARTFPPRSRTARLECGSKRGHG